MCHLKMKKLSLKMRMLRVQKTQKKINRAYLQPFNRIHIKYKEHKEVLQAGKKMDALSKFRLNVYSTREK
jgi:hypothetical protein